MPLPPPPPPGPPPPPAFNAPPPPKGSKGSGGGDKNQLLAEIRKGTGLKKVQTNDRSAPIIENKSNGRSGGGGGGQMNGGPPGLAGLFAGGMPVLKPSGGRGGGPTKGPPLMPFNKRAPSTEDQEEPSPSHSPQTPQSRSGGGGGLPAGFGTVRKGFLNEAIKAQAPQPPSSTMKPFNNNRLGPAVPLSGPPLPNKPPGVKLNPSAKVTPPSNKPPPPPKSPAVMGGGGPPALPSKPPSSFRRHQSFNEYDARPGSGNRNHHQGSNNSSNRPTIKIHNANNGGAEVGAKTPSPPVNAFLEGLNAKQASFKNASSTPNLAALGVIKAAPPPPPQRDPGSQQFHTMPKPPPPPNRTTPYNPKASPASRPPPPPPSSNKVLSPPHNPPPPPPPHRLNNPPPPPLPQNQPLRGVPVPINNLPPPPPVRNSSARNSFSGSNSTLNANNNDDELESRVYHLFISLNSLPAPDPFTNSPKNYASKNAQVHNARIAAPPIPTQSHHTQLQLGPKLWANPTSDC